MDGEVLVAGVVALLALIADVLGRRRSRFDQQMTQALLLLTGKTQRRSAGIAIMEGLAPRLRRWRRVQRAWHRAACGHVANQIVYLLTWSEEEGRPDEVHNLRRLVRLLAALRPPDRIRQRAVDALEQRTQASDTTPVEGPPKGLWLRPGDVNALLEQARAHRGVAP